MPKGKHLIWVVVIALGAIWIANNIPAVASLVAPRKSG